MADELTITTTTNTPEEVREALGLKPETPATPEPAKAETPAAAPEATPAAKAEETKAEDTSAADAARTLAKRKGTLQDRLDRLTREKLTAREELAAARAELASLKAGKPVATTVPEPAKTIPEPVAATKPEPKSEDFEEFNDYLKALSAYTREQAKEEAKADMRAEIARQREEDKRAADQERETASAKELQAAFNTRMNEARKRHPDMDTVLEQNTNVPISDTMKAAIHHEEYGAELLYYWGTHPSEADEIAALTPAQALKVIGKLEARYEAGTLFDEATDDDAPETPAEGVTVRKGEKVPVSKAPAPPPRVGSGAAAVAKDPDKTDYQEYKRLREAELKARKRR